MNKLLANTSTEMAEMYSQIIEDTIINVLGSDVTEEQVSKHCGMYQYPDGSQIFTVDDHPFLKIGPMKAHTEFGYCDVECRNRVKVFISREVNVVTSRAEIDHMRAIITGGK